MHRRHHSHADTPKDPHSPVHLKNIISFNLATVVEYRKLVNEFMKDGRTITDAPRWYRLESIAESLWTRAAFILLYFLFYVFFATSAWQFLLFPSHIIMCSMHGFIVNWFGHKTGYRNYDSMPDNSKNTLPVDFLMMGELYQNNHHRYPQKMNFEVKWFEVDFGFHILKILQFLRIITIK